jgi:hypothetical protein
LPRGSSMGHITDLLRELRPFCLNSWDHMTSGRSRCKYVGELLENEFSLYIRPTFFQHGNKKFTFQLFFQHFSNIWATSWKLFFLCNTKQQMPNMVLELQML